MAATLKVKKIEKFDIQAQNETVLNVTVGIMDNGQEIEERLLNFPLNTSSEALKAELSKFIKNYNLEVKQAVENADRDAAHAQADEVISEMTDMEITEDEAVEPAEVPNTDVTFEAPMETLTDEVK